MCPGTLTLLEIVLGIDNIIFLSLVVAKLPTAQRAHARRIGLMGAMVMRLALLASIAWVVKLTNPLFTVFGQEISFLFTFDRFMDLFTGFPDKE